jgi:hypothetical protein
MHNSAEIAPAPAEAPATIDEAPSISPAIAEPPVEQPVPHESLARHESSAHHESSADPESPARHESPAPSGPSAAASIEIVAAPSNAALPPMAEHGDEASPLGFSSSAEPIAEVPVGELGDQHPIEPAPPAADVEAPVETHSTPEEQSVSEPESKPVLVQEVTKSPENPRRGWWQRLIQS